jgi:hypothetical protein
MTVLMPLLNTNQIYTEIQDPFDLMIINNVYASIYGNINIKIHYQSGNVHAIKESIIDRIKDTKCLYV